MKLDALAAELGDGGAPAVYGHVVLVRVVERLPGTAVEVRVDVADRPLSGLLGHGGKLRQFRPVESVMLAASPMT